jgi:hypothetical protein
MTSSVELPTPIALSKKLSSDNNALNMTKEKVVCSISNVYGAAINAVMLILRIVSFIARAVCQQLKAYAVTLLASIHKHPETSTAVFTFVLTFMLHIVTISGGFVWDDRAAILGNPDVLGTRLIFPHMFTHDFWGNDMALEESHKSYRPLAVASLRFTNFRAGVSASAFHFDNVVLHSIVAYMYSKICFQLVQKYMKSERLATMSAMLSSILFAVHPIHTEPVASGVGKLVECLLYPLHVIMT